MVNLPNILPINVVGTISGTAASGTPTSIFSLAAIQNVVIVNEDPLEVNLVGGSSSDLVSVSGHLQSEIDAVEASDVDALTVSGGSNIAGTIDFVGSNGVNISDSGNTITIDGAGISDNVGITALIEDTNPTLGSDMDADEFDIAGIHELTAATGTFTTSLTAPTGTFSNLTSLNQLTAVTGTFNDGLGTGGNLTVGGNTLLNQLTASTGAFSQSLTISGVPVVTTDQVGITSVVEDTTPQLGGNLDGQNFNLDNINQFTDLNLLSSVSGIFLQSLNLPNLPTDSGSLNSGDVWVDVPSDFTLKVTP